MTLTLNTVQTDRAGLPGRGLSHGHHFADTGPNPSLPLFLPGGLISLSLSTLLPSPTGLLSTTRAHRARSTPPAEAQRSFLAHVNTPLSKQTQLTHVTMPEPVCTPLLVFGGAPFILTGTDPALSSWAVAGAPPQTQARCPVTRPRGGWTGRTPLTGDDGVVQHLFVLVQEQVVLELRVHQQVLLVFL